MTWPSSPDKQSRAYTSHRLVPAARLHFVRLTISAAIIIGTIFTILRAPVLEHMPHLPVGFQGQEQCPARLRRAGVDLGFLAEAKRPGSQATLTLAQNETLTRHLTHESIARAFDRSGLQLGGRSQGLALSDLFNLGSARGASQAILVHLPTPVRALVLPLLSRSASAALSSALYVLALPAWAPGDLWLQDPTAFHATLVHASQHTDERPVDRTGLLAEMGATLDAAAGLCPLALVLERVVATPEGALLACWQVAGGEEPRNLRRSLLEALPAAKGMRQNVRETALLYVTLARALRPPLEDWGKQGRGGMRRVAAALTDRLCGLSVVADRVWYVQEFDRLALALGGEFIARSLPLDCSKAKSYGQ